MDFEFAALVSGETFLFGSRTSTVWLQFEWMNSVFRHRTPHWMPHHSSNFGPMWIPELYYPLPPLPIWASEPYEDNDYYSSREEEEQRIWDATTNSYRSRGSGLSRGTVADYLGKVAGCSESEEICTICQDDIHATKETAKLRCGHVFHIGCIEDWLMVKNECPVCRASVVPAGGTGRRR